MKPATMGDRRGELRTKRKDNRKVALPQDLVTELQREGNTACTISDTRTFFKLKRDPSVVCPSLKYCCTKGCPRKMISVSQISAEYAQIFEITDIAATIRLSRTGGYLFYLLDDLLSFSRRPFLHFGSGIFLWAVSVTYARLYCVRVFGTRKNAFSKSAGFETLSFTKAKYPFSLPKNPSKVIISLPS